MPLDLLSASPDPVPVPGDDRRVADGEVLAAVDLGSNSFHMLVARLQHGEPVVIDRLREPVRLGAGLVEGKRLDSDSRERALACLRRFGQRLREVRPDRVRAVGTSTLRQARKARAFRAECEEALGHAIEVVSGREEARLVYLGVTHTLPPEPGRRLVLDIGGGSTELIIGRGPEPLTLESLHMGCVNMTREHFPDGRLSAPAFAQARLAARLELRPVRAYFAERGWDSAAGTSGTVRAAAAVAAQLGYCDTGITAEAAERLVERLLDAGRVGRLDLPGLSRDRAQVFAGGLAVLVEVLSGLDVATMDVADGALREGVLYDLLGRLRAEDARERSVRAMALRYHVDLAQADRVAATAGRFFLQLEQPLGLDGERDRRLLDWAARLHEIGLDIAHGRYHRHGAYLLEHADLPGFARAEQRLLALLVGGHRRRLDELALERLPESWQRTARWLVVILRLAVLLHRSRNGADTADLDLALLRDELVLSGPPGWLQDNPLTRADLRQEASHLRALGVALTACERTD